MINVSFFFREVEHQITLPTLNSANLNESEGVIPIFVFPLYQSDISMGHATPVSFTELNYTEQILLVFKLHLSRRAKQYLWISAPLFCPTLSETVNKSE